MRMANTHSLFLKTKKSIQIRANDRSDRFGKGFGVIAKNINLFQIRSYDGKQKSSTFFGARLIWLHVDFSGEKGQQNWHNTQYTFGVCQGILFP